MRLNRYSASRQRSCQQCSSAKARCDRQPRGCSRCAQRGLDCSYPQCLSVSDSVRPVGGTGTAKSDAGELLNAASAGSHTDPSHRTRPYVPFTLGDTNRAFQTEDELPTSSRIFTDPISLPRTGIPGLVEADPERLSFAALSLVCPIEATSIANRWLDTYIPNPEKVPKDYNPKTLHFICQMLKSYVGSIIRARGYPPFIHSTQLATSSLCPVLATCLNIVRVCHRPLPGSDVAISDAIKREMAKAIESAEAHDEITLLAIFQSYLIYAMVLFFRTDAGSSGTIFPEAKLSLQELASLCSQRGIMCAEEQQRARPRWESWLVAEAKRRTLFTTYLFDSVLSRYEGLPTFLATELRGLPAPASKALWEARTRWKWNIEYNSHLAEWPNGGVSIDELWSLSSGAAEAGIVERSGRIDRWLEDTDAYGVMLYAVTCTTHGV